MNGDMLRPGKRSPSASHSPTGDVLPRFELLKVSIPLGAILMMVLGLGIASSFAQDDVTVTGTVTDATDGLLIPGVNVVVQGAEAATGSTVGTTTDMNGAFTVNVPEGLNTIVFSFIGYVTQEVELDGRTELNVELVRGMQMLDDVVVVGYGTQERRQVTGSISSVSSEDFLTGYVNSAAELIQGKVPGLMVTRPGANPNQRPVLRSRGVSSFGQAQEPLIVVDGVIGASLDNIDPNDIETIDFLKDASAAAIYGTRGGAGVIAITTKRGQSGITAVSYNGQFTSIGVENRLDVLTADQFRQLSQMSGVEINDLGSSTNWFNEITQPSYQQTHNLSISGGTENTTYRISGNFRDNQGLQRTTGFEQRGARVNLDHRALNNRLALGLNLGATNREIDYGFPQAFRYAATFNPTAPVRNDGFESTGGYTEIAAFDLFNPVAILETAEDIREERHLNASLNAAYHFDDFVPGLSVGAFYALETEDFVRNQFWARTNKLTGGASEAALGRGRADREALDTKREQFDVTTNYRTSLTGQFHIEALAGYSFQEFEERRTRAAGGNFISDAVGSNNLGFAQDFNNGLGTVQSHRNTNRLIAGFGRLSLDWDHTYFLNASFRREGSSRFGVHNRWGTFGSLGAGVDVSNIVDLGAFDLLRVRGSYGVTGLDAPFDGISRLRFAPRGNFFVGGDFVQSFGPVSNNNPDLKWEEKEEFNFGVDFALMEERLTGSLEYYQNTTSDLIYEIEVPVPPNLFPTSWMNVGTIENKGLEAMLGYDVVRRSNVHWNTSATFTTFDVRLAQFESDVARYIANVGSPGQNNTQQVRIRQGEPLGQLWGPRFAGIDEDGTWKFFNAAGDRVTSDEIAREDEAIIGNGIPDFQIGWTNTFRYSNFDFRIHLRGVFGHDLVNSARVFFENPPNISSYNVVASAMDLAHLMSSPAYSSFHIEDASFVRLENLSIGYNIPLPSGSLVNRVRVVASGNNLLTITNYSGIDPEVRWLDGNNPLAIGIERREVWYTARTFTFGVNLDF